MVNPYTITHTTPSTDWPRWNYQTQFPRWKCELQGWCVGVDYIQSCYNSISFTETLFPCLSLQGMANLRIQFPNHSLTHEINKLKSEDRSLQLVWHDARVWVMSTLSYCGDFYLLYRNLIPSSIPRVWSTYTSNSIQNHQTEISKIEAWSWGDKMELGWYKGVNVHSILLLLQNFNFLYRNHIPSSIH